jgi:hypothetical protein
MEYESELRKFHLATLYPLIDIWGKYDLIHRNGDCSRGSNMRTLVFRNKVCYQNPTPLQNTTRKYPPTDNGIRRWLTQYQDTGFFLRRKGARRLSTSQEVVDRIQEVFSRSPQKSRKGAHVEVV